MATVRDLSGNSPKGFGLDLHIDEPGVGIDASDLATEAKQDVTNTKLDTLINDNSPAAVYTNLRIIDVDLTVSTSAYSANDVLVATFPIAGAAAAIDLPCTLQRVYLVDWDGVAPNSGVSAIFWDSNISLGAANAVAAFSSQADAKHYQGHAVVNSTAQAIGTPKIMNQAALGLPMKPASGTTTIYCTLLLISGTPTFTHADAMSARFIFS